MDLKKYLYYLNKLRINSEEEVEREFKRDSGVTTWAYIPREGNIVIKGNKSGYSYCGRSVEIYKKACDRGVGFLFAEIKKGFKIDKYNFSFCQEKVPLTAGIYFDNTGEGKELQNYYNEIGIDYLFNYELQDNCEEYEYVEENYYIGEYEDISIVDDILGSHYISISLFGAIIDFYGEEIALDFLIFCFENTINDLHDWNWGFLDGRPIIFDFAGYMTEEVHLRGH